MLSAREKIRAAINTTHKNEFDIIFLAISHDQDIIPALPEMYIEYLRRNIALADALDDADYLLGLTLEILPEYSHLLDSKKTWLERQLAHLRSRIEGR